MSTFTYQILKDTNKIAIVKLNGIFTSSVNESNDSRVSANTLSGALNVYGFGLVNGGDSLPYYKFNINKIYYSISNGLTVELYYNSTNKTSIIELVGNGNYNNDILYMEFSNYEVGTNGDIGLRTIGAANNGSYSIVLELHKDNLYYDSGKLAVPQDFNYFVRYTDSLAAESGDIISDTNDNNLDIPTYQNTYVN
jgi:hypothetical protein